ncbi:MAG: HlyD family efflux transporter periplasmic adaptor subunit [Planctomycetaceae bacterium]|nr:HlyD family efflux transporter periplasmic adaptor subunit [Planctomycetaceae bacterium]
MSRCLHFSTLIVLALTAGMLCAAEPAAKKKASATADKKAQPAADKKADEKKPESAAKKAETPETPPPATVTLKRKPLRISFELEGVFEAESAHEVTVRPEEWNSLTVETAVAHGATVRKGDVLIKLETDKLDQAIADLRADLKITEVAARQVEEQLKAMEHSVPIELKASRRAARIAEEDERFFFAVAKPFELKAAAFQIKSAKQALEYEQEELRQLEKMYKADDITEETEEIVLRRARDTVDRAKFSLEVTQLMADHAVKYGLPRREDEVKEVAKRTALEAAKREVELPLAERRLRFEAEKLRMQRAEAEKRLHRLLADRAEMTVTAPADGIVYYGKLSRGKPADASAMADTLRPHGGIPANQVVMTVVEPRPMAIRATVPENQLHDLRPGLSATAIPTGYPDEELSAAVDTVSDIPMSPGNFDGRLTVELTKRTKLLRPGMTCKIKLTPYRKADALCVPPTALITDELDEHKQSVQVLEKDGKIADRPVTVGRKTDKQVEILKGLAEGDKVVIEPKKDEK